MLRTKKILAISCLIFIAFYFINCEREDMSIGKGVEFYLIDKFEYLDNGHINPSKMTVQIKPFIEYKDVISYEPLTYTYEFSDRIQKHFESIENWNDSFMGKAFILKVNDEFIYIGRFWSANFQSIAGNIGLYFLPESKNFQARIIEPSSLISIEDKRNDLKILAVLKQDGKLIE